MEQGYYPVWMALSLPEFLKHMGEFVEEKNINDEWL